MNSNQKTRKAKAGLLLIASPRFKTLGEGLRRGTYAERKDADVKKILATMEFLDVVFPGIVYDKEEAVEAMDRFYMEKVDFVIAEFRRRGRLLLSGLRAVFVGAIRPALFIRRLLPGAIRPAPFIRHYPSDIPFKPHFFSVANERICQVTPTATASSAACAHHHPESGAKTQ